MSKTTSSYAKTTPCRGTPNATGINRPVPISRGSCATLARREVRDRSSGSPADGRQCSVDDVQRFVELFAGNYQRRRQREHVPRRHLETQAPPHGLVHHRLYLV